jgi:hypothetical protein
LVLVDVLVALDAHPGDVEHHLARRDGVAIPAGPPPARAVARPLRAGELRQVLHDGGGGGTGLGLRPKVAAQHERELVLANELDEPDDDGMAEQPMRRHPPAAEPAEPRHLGLARPRGLPEGGKPLARRRAPPQLLETHARDPGEQRRLRPHALLARLRPPERHRRHLARHDLGIHHRSVRHASAFTTPGLGPGRGSRIRENCSPPEGDTRSLPFARPGGPMGVMTAQSGQGH